MAALNQCAATHQQVLPADGVKVSLTIAGNGSVREAVLSPASLRGTGLDSCLAKIVAKMRFPRHRDNEAKVTVPLQFRIGQ
jgi:serine/threonine-protein kinase